MLMKVAAACLLSSIATNSPKTLAWQQWQPPHSNFNPSNNNKFERRPSNNDIRYLENDAYDPDTTFDYGSPHNSNEIKNPAGRVGGNKRKIHAKIKPNTTKKNLSFHNYPQHIAPVTDDATSDKTRRKRSRLTSNRSNSNSAILPTKRNTKSKDNSSSKLLTFEEEMEIAHHIQAYAAVMRVKNDIVSWMSKEPSTHLRMGLSNDEEYYIPSDEQWASACSLSVPELHNVIHCGQEARTKLITGNVGLVTNIAKKYYHLLKPSSASGAGTLKLDDLIQEGYIGIMDAAERFDPEKGYRFSTYGSYWVRQRILRSISESSRIIRLPEHVQNMLRNIHKKRQEFTQLIGRSPSLPELAHELSISLEKITLYQHLTITQCNNIMSLEHQLNANDYKPDNREQTIGDRIPCNEVPSPEDDAMSEAFRGEVHSMLDHLNESERMVLTHRFGLEDGYPRTIREISEEMCVSGEIVRGIEAKALNKLREPRMMYRLKDFVDGSRSDEEGFWEGGNNGYFHPHYHNGMPPGYPMHNGHDYYFAQQQQQHMMNMEIMEHEHEHQMYNNGVVIDDDLDEYERPTPESIWSF